MFLFGFFGVIVGINNYIVWGFINVNLDNVDWIVFDDDILII